MDGLSARHACRWAGLSLALPVVLALIGLSAASAAAQSADAEAAKKERLERMKEKLKKLDPSMVLFLDSKGNVAGRGDASGVVGEAERSGMAEHPMALELANLPQDKYGLVDWAESLRSGKITPKDSLDPSAKPKPPLDLDVVIQTKSKYQPDVVFPHKIHTMWLDCENCHDAIFKPKAGGNPEMHMVKIAAGEYCGRCHNRVAFPLSDCLRCHVKPKPGTEHLFQETAPSQPRK
ncbi:MAG: c(7)-type cytochrome triheme domain-containing protein [Nitrospirota bacterium]